MPLDPQMKLFVDQLAAAGVPPDFPLIGAEAARAMAASRPMPGEGPDMFRIKDLLLPGSGVPVPARLYVPHGGAQGLLVFLHGGGWVLGTIASYDPPVRHFADRAKLAILSVEYRLAPEHPYPAAIDDCYAAVRWAAENLAALGLSEDLPVAVGGDSAGGNLAAVTALLARERGAPAIAAQLLIYPATDADFTTSSYLAHAEQLPLTARAMQWFWDQYIPDTSVRRDPLASPLRAENLSGLPPTFIVLAGYDPLLSEGEKFLDRLSESGVRCAASRYDGLTHGFFQFSELLPVAGDALEEIADRFSEFLATDR